MIKTTLTLLIAFVFSLTCFAQKAQPVNFSTDSFQHESILKVVPGYKLSFDTIQQNNADTYRRIYYKNDEGDELQFFYKLYMKGANADLKIKGTPTYQFKSIIGQYLTIYKIYNQYYGRDITMEKLKEISGETWRFDKGSLNLTKADNKGQWMMRLSPPPTIVKE